MSRAWCHYGIALGLLTMAVPVPRYLNRDRQMPLQRPLSDFSLEVGNWRGSDEPLSDRVRIQLGTDDILLRQYVEPGGTPVLLYASYFPRQGRGEISHSPKNCLPGAGWQPLRARRVPYPLAATDTDMINEILYEKEGQRQLVFYWFRERDRILASEYLVKWYLMWDAVTRDRTDGALLRVSTAVIDSEEMARQRCLDFMRVTLPRLNAILPN